MNALLRAALAVLSLAASFAQAQTCPAGYPRTTPDSDFADAGNGTVRHIPTGLVWKRCAEGQTWNGSTCTGSAAGYTWQQAFQQADAVNSGAPGTQNAGFTDWRVPNQKELRSIVERGCYNPSINTTQFPATPASGFWSGSPVAGGSGRAWGVDFLDGGAGWGNRDVAGLVRLVRAGQYFYHFDAARYAVAGPIATRGAGVTANLRVDGCGTITGANFIDAPAGAPAGTVFPNGLLNLGLGSCTAGGTVTVTVTFSSPLPADVVYYKETGGVYTAYPATISADRTSVTFTLTDGGAGDADGLPNSAIADPSGAGAGGITGVPTLSEWGLAILALLMAGMAGLRMRRR